MSSKLLSSHRAAILPRWVQLILQSYPADTARLLESEPDQFLNPVGSNISREAETLFGEIEGEMGEEKLSASLDSLMSIRAVQDFPPSKAVGIIFLLKQAVREGLKDEPHDARFYEELQEIESRVDRVALMAFDQYMGRREKIYELKLREASERADAILGRMYFVPGAPDEM
ncbi:MAG TPA: RsbRD N-terminal domain-containing protein [Chloroflexota bacterium]|nr:RsbRD N-terminal domain-containing protein [Chloroflexota bacterium]